MKDKEMYEAVCQYMRNYILDYRFMKFIYACMPNNWLKMHGYPKRRKGWT